MRLRPGVVVVRRDDRHLQLGLAPPHRVVLPDVPETRALLDALERERPIDLDAPHVAQAVARLTHADLLEIGTVAGAEPTVALSGRRSLVAAAAPVLRTAGISISQDAEVRLLLGVGAVARHATDPLVRDGLAHLVAAVTPWGWDVGPFVVPGETACLRCVDAAMADRDPRHGVVVDQVARAAVTVPTSPAVQALALGWIARDLVAYAAGVRPATWSTTIRLTQTPGEEPVDERHWLRHPRCGCAWDALAG